MTYIGYVVWTVEKRFMVQIPGFVTDNITGSAALNNLKPLYISGRGGGRYMFAFLSKGVPLKICGQNIDSFNVGVVFRYQQK